MARINSNIPALTARAHLARANEDLNVRLQRLSTGLRINRGADDPAGLIISERLRSDIQGVEQGIKNAERASAVISTTEASLAEVNDLLTSIRALVVEAANTGALSDEEREANQLQIDSAIESITRISNTATFGGLRLLNGELDYQLSGVSTSAIALATVHGASFVGSPSLNVEVEVLHSAQTGALFVRGDLPTVGSPLNGTILSSTTLQIQGSRGVTELNFTSGTQLSAVVASINNISALTGVRAEMIDTSNASSGMVFKSVEYGDNAYVSIRRIDGPSASSGGAWQTYRFADSAEFPAWPPLDMGTLVTNGSLTSAQRDAGRDVTALINGSVAAGKGLETSINTPGLSVTLLLNEDLATDPSAAATSFSITGGGALFQLGPEVTAQQQVSLGVRSTAASNLGGTLVSGNTQFLSSLKSGGINDLRASVERGDFTQASDILNAAIDEVSVMRGRLGAFEKNVLSTNVRSLESSLENLSASASVIRDADFARETSELTRAQILASASTASLSLANQQSQQVLQLLG